MGAACVHTLDLQQNSAIRKPPGTSKKVYSIGECSYSRVFLRSYKEHWDPIDHVFVSVSTYSRGSYSRGLLCKVMQ